MFYDINGNQLNAGDNISIQYPNKNGRDIYTLHERDYSNVPQVRGSGRLCIGNSVTQPTPDYVLQCDIRKI